VFYRKPNSWRLVRRCPESSQSCCASCTHIWQEPGHSPCPALSLPSQSGQSVSLSRTSAATIQSGLGVHQLWGGIFLHRATQASSLVSFTLYEISLINNFNPKSIKGNEKTGVENICRKISFPTKFYNCFFKALLIL